MKKFLKILFTLLVISTILFPSANASALSEEEMQLEKQQIHISSVENYIKYLDSERNNGNPLAEEGLKKFLLLEKKEQKAFIKALKETEKLSNALAEKEGGLTTLTTVDDVKVPVRTQEITEEVPINGATINALAAGSLTVTATESLYVFNIKVSTLYTSTSFNHNGTSAISIITGDHWHSNINPAMLFSKEQAASQNYLSGGRAYHRGNWTVYATGSFGFINDSIQFWVSANATSRSKQLYSTHPNMTGYSWKSF
ncbi:MAG TPA: hypothetical protein DDY49_10535 [Paenibacillaceae bacterium]|nr:hypothetical protein [Paenibacillaceae bacterium]